MSSPIASDKKGSIRNFMIGLHQRLSHVKRVSILSRRIGVIIGGLYSHEATIRCLDAGCGDMKIAEGVNRLCSRTDWQCIDLYDLPEHMRKNGRWSKYQKYDGRHFPFSDASFDIVLFCDVLHHATNIPDLLRDAARVGRRIIIKDHFEYSFYSRVMLKVMDFIGNWGYGVPLPRKYFTPVSFQELCSSVGLSAAQLETGIDLYSHLPVIRHLLKPEWHFIAVLRPASVGQ
ncbi:MAG: methyltransferase domain-containing protein [Candidatus Sulfobium sp.]|jgi:SAM-dependent methyltransferase